MTVSSQVRRRCDEIVSQARRATDVASVFEVASGRLRQLVPFDTAMWYATDPVTGLPSAPPYLQGIVDNEDCRGYWDHELQGTDVNQYRDLARSHLPVGTLQAATGGRPTRSSRYAQFLSSAFDDELRAVLRIGGITWGVVSLLRTPDRPSFSESDVAVVATLSRPLAAALRACARRGRPLTEATARTDVGLLVFDSGGDLASINDAARHWLAELHDPADTSPTSLGVPLPTWLVGTVVRARDLAEAAVPPSSTAAHASHPSRPDPTSHLSPPPGASARVRSRSGQWLTCSASCLRDRDGAIASTALVLEPARATDVAPILAEAYELTDREKQVAGLVARGASTAEIAGVLYLSTHTVRDHIKSVFEKLQVSSRGELVAKLFAEHHFSMPLPLPLPSHSTV